MHHTTLHVTPDPETQTRLVDAVRARGVQPVARDLGVARSALTAYLAGACRDGTIMLIEARASRLASTEAR